MSNAAPVRVVRRLKGVTAAMLVVFAIVAFLVGAPALTRAGTEWLQLGPYGVLAAVLTDAGIVLLGLSSMVARAEHVPVWPTNVGTASLVSLSACIQVSHFLETGLTGPNAILGSVLAASAPILVWLSSKTFETLVWGKTVSAAAEHTAAATAQHTRHVERQVKDRIAAERVARVAAAPQAARPQHAEPAGKKMPKPEAKAAARELVAAGVSLSETARQVGFSRPAVSAWVTEPLA